MFKNTASQKLIVYCFDSTTNLPKTGDAANLTAYVSKDYGSVTVLADTSATEMDATNAKGYYLFDLAQGETNGDTLLFSCKSATANIVCLAMPATVFTRPPNFSAMSIDSNGRVDIIKVAGTTQTARDIGGAVPAATAGASGGLLISGSNSGTTTFGALTVTGATTLTGAVSLGSTLGVTGTATFAAIACTTLTASGAVAFQSTFAVTGATTLTGAVTASSASNNIVGIALTAAGVDAILDEVIDAAGTTFRQSLRGTVAALLGKASGMASNAPVFRDIADGKNVISATTDANGNRTAVTLDLS